VTNLWSAKTRIGPLHFPAECHRRWQNLALVFGWPFVKRFALCYRSVVCLSVCLSVCPVCNVDALSPSGWMDQDATWHAARPRPQTYCVRWGPSCPPQKREQSPQFSANVHCGQTAGWTKMPLGMEIGLGPGNFVFDGDPATQEKRAQHPLPIFGPCLLWPNGWMDQDATWYGDTPQPRWRCVRWGCSSP